MDALIPRIPLGKWIEGGLKWLTTEYSNVTRGIARLTQNGIDILNDALIAVPQWGMMFVVALICWRLSGWRLALGSVLGLGLIQNMGYWEPML